MSGECGGNRHSHRFLIPHFSDENYVRALTENVSEPGLKAFCVASYFSLGNSCFFGFVDEFNWVLNADNVRMTTVVDFINYCSQCGAFSRSSSSSDEYEATLFFGQFPDHIR